MEGWYVAKIKQQKESALMGFLSQCGVQVFFPKIVSPGHNGHPGNRLQALFPTYLFCHLDPESANWPLVRWAPGLSYFLGCDGEPSCMPQDLIDYLRLRVTQWNDPEYARQLASGDKVVVTGGPFEGLEGIFQRYIPSKQRCRIFLEVLGRLTSVELPEWEVEGTSSSLLPV